jgi:hypothetical protein
MGQSDKGQPAPVTHDDPADVFVEIYDRLPVAWFRREELELWIRSRQLANVAEPVTDACLEQGVLDRNWISGIVANGAEYELAVLVGIDDALKHASPWWSGTTAGGMARVRDRYLIGGRLNRATDGALLPRSTFPGRPLAGKEKRDFFRVMRVPAEIWGTSYVNTVLNRSQDELSCRPTEPVIVAFVPLLASYKDLSVEFTSHPRLVGLRYRLAPQDAVIDRLPAVLETLDRSGAHLAVLPEACLSDEILAAWRELLRRVRPGRRSKLRWLLLGSGPVDGAGNRALLVNRLGRELLRQDKLSDFTLTPWQLEGWQMPEVPDEALRHGAVVRENVRRDVAFQTLDTGLGRVGVLICESLDRWSEVRQEEVLGSSTSHVFAPVFSKPIRQDGWEDKSSEYLSNHVGSWVMVSNSLATAHELASDVGDRPWYSCLVSGPYEERRTRYQLTRAFGRSGDHLSPAVQVDASAADDDLPVLLSVRTARLSSSWFPELAR